MAKITIWEDDAKQGETYGGWFFMLSYNGNVTKIEGGFASKEAAEKAANAC